MMTTDTTMNGAGAIPDIRTTKRKLDDAFQSLDDAVARPDYQPPPLKKSNTARSLYSTLAKYGIKSKEQPAESYSKKTPHLSAILSRTATRTRQAFPFKFPAPAPISNASGAEYRPSSISSFLSRLSTFKLSTYANKPSGLDAVAASKCGWINNGKDRLLCGICNSSWVVASRDGMSRDAANALVEKQKGSLVSAHKEGCPWKTRQCDASIYRIPLQSPTTTLRDIKLNALSLESLLSEIEVKHPLTANQLSSLHSTIKLYSLSSESADCHEPSETAILTSLFGWSIARPMAPPASFPRTPSISRATSLVPSAPSTPTRNRSSTPGQGSVTPLRLSVPPRASTPAKQDTLLHCSLCQRRVGLWAFAQRGDSSVSSRNPARRQFDLLKEHRSYCPYIVRSTVIPSLSLMPRPSNSSTVSVNGSGEMEGWRAVLLVALRYGLAQRSQLSGQRVVEGEEVSGQEVQEVDGGVTAMMQGVKARGGKELLNYVKSLLG